MLPESGSYRIGEIFEVKVLADSGGVPINAVEAELNFNPTALAVETISTENSILSSFSTEPTFSNTDGVIAFSGWTGGTFTGNDGLLITITFKALRDASANAHLAAGAMLAVQDGSNIITSMKSGVYTVAPRELVRPRLPQNSSSTPETVPEIISVPAPSPLFSQYAQSIRAGDQIVVQGTTDPSARLIVWLQKGSEETMHSVTSNADGSFTFTAPRPAEEGVYRIWAAVEDVYGVPGPQSDRIAINVRSSGLAASVVPSTDLISTLLPYITLLLFVALATGYLVHRHKVAKRHHF
jgi:antitoxin (DNA-binding transcriptional repressor) of toxin-antitoxin stability system